MKTGEVAFVSKPLRFIANKLLETGLHREETGVAE